MLQSKKFAFGRLSYTLPAGSVFQILARRDAEGAAEHGGETTGAVIADVIGDLRDRRARREQRQRLHQPHLLPPHGEPHPRFLLEAAREGAPSRSEEHTSELQSLMRISYAVFCLK